MKKYIIVLLILLLLTGCKKGCHKCSVLETDRCTECEEGYYKEDPFNVTRKTFKCFERDVKK